MPPCASSTPAACGAWKPCSTIGTSRSAISAATRPPATPGPTQTFGYPPAPDFCLTPLTGLDGEDEHITHLGAS
jgi:hypothetical protein